jgi:predicted nucleic acid-binding protein
MSAEPVFIDTNVLVAAAIEAHPSHAVASALLARLATSNVAPCISPQVCREFLSVVTRGPVEGRAFSPQEALDALSGFMPAVPCSTIPKRSCMSCSYSWLGAEYAASRCMTPTSSRQ